MFSFLKKFKRRPLEKGALQKAFHDAVTKGEIRAAKRRLKQGVDIHHDNEAALAQAVAKEKWDMAIMLLEQGAEAAKLKTDLMGIATSKGMIELTQALIDQGMRPDESNSPRNALIQSANKGWLKYTAFLIEQGMDVHIGNEAPLEAAVNNRKWDLVKALISEHGATPEKLKTDLLDTALHRGQIDLAKALVQRGMKLNTGNSDDNALVIIAEKGWKDASKWLIAEGLDVHVGNERPLLAAVKARKWDYVEWLIEEQDADATALPFDLVNRALRSGRPGIAQKLVARGMKLNDSDSPNNSLVIAASKGWKQTSEWMIEAGMDIHVGNERPLLAAVENGKWDLVEWLVEEQDADPAALPFDLVTRALQKGRPGIAKKLVARGMALNESNSDENSLVIVASKGWQQTSEWMIEAGLDIHVGNERPLLAAVENSKWDLVKWLVEEQDADPEALPFDLVDRALRSGRPNIAKKLVGRGMALNDSATDDNSLVIAATKGWQQTSEWMIELGMDIHVGNERPLATAVAHDKWDQVGWLLDQGADATKLPYDLIDHALRKGRLKIVEKLVNLGLEVDTTDSPDHAIVEAASKNRQQSVDFLLDNGVSIHTGNNAAIAAAAENKRWDMVEHLIKKGADATRLIGMENLPEKLQKPVEESALRASARQTMNMRRIRRTNRRPVL